MKKYLSELFFICQFIYGTIIHIPEDFPTIQEGIDTSSVGDTVLVSSGEYFETIDFDGKAITAASHYLTTGDSTYIFETIINGGGTGTVVNFSSDEDSTSLLTGFTITNGYGVEGGGIACKSGASPTISNSIITDNESIVWGGGFYITYGSSPKISNCTISNNHAYSGGGLYCLSNTSPYLENVTIISNNAYVGGGISCNSSSTVNLKNVTISGNSADSNGGGIYSSVSGSNMLNTIIWDNLPEEVFFDNLANPSSITVSYSDIQYGETGIITNNNGTVNWQEGNLEIHPLFCDPDSSFYTLAENSPCLSTGENGANMGAWDVGCPPIYFGPVWYVSTEGSDVSGDGSEESPFATIQLAVNTAPSGDTVLVFPGTYFETITFPFKSLIVGSQFILSGDTSYISQTIINGNQNGSVVTFSDSQDSTAILSGLTLTNGSESYGGGIFCENASSPTLQNLIISSNFATDGGGISCLNFSIPYMRNITLKNNSASNAGGGMYLYYSNPNMLTVEFLLNEATELGGGLACEHSSPVIVYSTFNDNTSNYGGGIYCRYSSSPTLTDVIISNNTAYQGGGLRFRDYSNAQVTGGSIHGNRAYERGGGIYCNNASPEFLYTPIFDNTADQGGGVFLRINSSPVFTNSTFTGNTAETGGAMECQENSSPQLVNSILWENTPEEVYFNPINDPNSISVSYSDVINGIESIDTNGNGTVEWGDGNIELYPLYCNSNDSDFSLGENSPCIAAGQNGENMGSFDIGCGPIYNGPVWHVSTTGSDSLGDGSEFNPFATIQYSINRAYDHDTVLVQMGTYIENINFSGKNLVVGSLYLETDDPTYIDETILDGNNNGSVVTLNSGEDSTSALIGFTINNGGGNVLDNITAGGGIYCSNADPVLAHLIIKQNVISIDDGEALGGGLYLKNSNAVLTNLIIKHNVASLINGTSYGGGIYIISSNPELSFVEVYNNVGNRGGGISIDGSIVDMDHLTIPQNYAENGGGLYCANGSFPIVTNSIIWYNGSSEIEFLSSGISNTLTISYSDLEGGSDGVVTNDNGVVSWLDGNIISDPVFCDISEYNFSLAENSPCISTGEGGVNMGSLGVGCSAEWNFSISDLVLNYTNEDSIWYSGDTLQIQLTMTNEGPADHFYYPGVVISTESEFITFPENGSEWFFYGLYAGQSESVFFTTVADTLVPDSTEIDFTVEAVAMNCEDMPEYCIDSTFFYFDEPVYSPPAGIGDIPGLPEEFALYQNYPNPFNPITTIRYDVPQVGQIRLIVYDLLGREVVTLVDKLKEAGRYSVLWNGTDQFGQPLSSGIYIYRIVSPSFMKTRKLVLLK